MPDDSGQRGLDELRVRKEFCRGQRRRGPHQRGCREQALQARQARVDIGALGPADRDLAGQEAREFNGRTGLDVAAGGVARIAVAVEVEVVHAGVALHLAERFQARHHLVGDTADAAILREVAVVIAGRGAVGQLRPLIIGAVHGGAAGDLQAVEILVEAEGAADRGVDRIALQARLDVRAAGIVGGDQQAPCPVSRVSLVTSRRPSMWPIKFGRSISIGADSGVPLAFGVRLLP